MRTRRTMRMRPAAGLDVPLPPRPAVPSSRADTVIDAADDYVPDDCVPDAYIPDDYLPDDPAADDYAMHRCARNGGAIDNGMQDSGVQNGDERDVGARGGGARDAGIGNDGARELLSGLAGVRADDEERASPARTRPRLSIEPVHALVVMAILVVMLAASLTLLVRQSINLASTSGEPTPVVTSPRAATRSDAPSCTSTPSTQTSEQAQSSESTQPSESSQSSQQTQSPQQTPSPEQTQSPTQQQQATPEPTPQLVDLNTATQEQLETVKGIGPVTAANIIAYRMSVGRLGAVDELLNIDGIGPKTLEKIRGQVTVR